MKISALGSEGLLLVEPTVHGDERGFFLETYRADLYAEQGITDTFVQDSHSRSVKDVIRGLKFQYDEPTAKLVRVASGSVFAVAVDIRPDSPTLGTYRHVELSEENHLQLYIPFGFAFGFCVTSLTADVLYKLSAVHNDVGSGTIRWDDSEIGIAWPTMNPIVADKDMRAPTFSTWLASPEASRFAGGMAT